VGPHRLARRDAARRDGGGRRKGGGAARPALSAFRRRGQGPPGRSSSSRAFFEFHGGARASGQRPPSCSPRGRRCRRKSVACLAEGPPPLALPLATSCRQTNRDGFTTLTAISFSCSAWQWDLPSSGAPISFRGVVQWGKPGGRTPSLPLAQMLTTIDRRGSYEMARPVSPCISRALCFSLSVEEEERHRLEAAFVTLGTLPDTAWESANEEPKDDCRSAGRGRVPCFRAIRSPRAAEAADVHSSRQTLLRDPANNRIVSRAREHGHAGSSMRARAARTA